MVGESNQNAFLIHIDASSFAEFEISEFEISRVDCTYVIVPCISRVEDINCSTITEVSSQAHDASKNSLPCYKCHFVHVHV